MRASPEEQAAVRRFATDVARAWEELAAGLGLRRENVAWMRPILVQFGLAVLRAEKAHETRAREQAVEHGASGHEASRTASGVMTAAEEWEDEEEKTTPIEGRSDRSTLPAPTEDTRPGTRRARTRRR